MDDYELETRSIAIKKEVRRITGNIYPLRWVMWFIDEWDRETKKLKNKSYIRQ